MIQLAAAISKLDAAKAFPSDADLSTRKSLVNQACERLILSGRLKSNRHRIAVSVGDTGIWTLPRNYETCLGVRIDGQSYDLASQWYQFLQHVSDGSDLSLYTDVLLDQGFGFCTFADPSGAVRLRLTAGSDTGSARVMGADENGIEIFSGGEPGFDLAIGVTSTQKVSGALSQLLLPDTDAIKLLYAVADDNTQTLIGRYYPGETQPDYRRYHTPTAVAGVTNAVDAICQMKHVDATRDNDLLFTSNIGALKNGVQAVHAEDEGDEARYTAKLTEAARLLNRETRLSHPDSERSAVRVTMYGGVPQRAML